LQKLKTIFLGSRQEVFADPCFKTPKRAFKRQHNAYFMHEMKNLVAGKLPCVTWSK